VTSCENAYSPYCSPYISHETSKEKLSKYQDIFSLVTSCENAYSPYCSPYISYGTSKENLSKYQDISLVTSCENACSPYCSPYISYGTSKENLSKYQDSSSLLITSFILITSVFEQVNDDVKGNFIFVTVRV